MFKCCVARFRLASQSSAPLHATCRGLDGGGLKARQQSISFTPRWYRYEYGYSNLQNLVAARQDKITMGGGSTSSAVHDGRAARVYT